jgi:hypothetical protein
MSQQSSLPLPTQSVSRVLTADTRRALKVPMSKIMRQAPSILPIVSELVSRRMPQHMRVNRKWQVRSPACSLNHPQEPSGCYWRACFAHEHIRPVSL